MHQGPVIALIDGEHHPSAVRDALDQIDRQRGVAGVVFCGGEEKVESGVLESAQAHYGRPVDADPDAAAALRRLAGDGDARVVVDLADEPVLDPPAMLRLASLALHLGLDFEAPGLRLEAPRYEAVDFAGPKLAVIGTGKRTGKTAVAGHWARLLRERGVEPVIVSMGRGGPPEPQLARPDTSLEDLGGFAAQGRHAASDYLEDAVLAGVAAVGCRRVGGGLGGQPFVSTVAAGVALAASLEPDALILEGSGACIPPVVADRTVCIVGDRPGALGELGPLRLLRADLALVMGEDDALAAAVAEIAPGEVVPFTLRPEPAEPVLADARVALFSTGPERVEDTEAVVASSNLARRSALESDLDRAAAEGCDVYLTELKAAAIDTVARRAGEAGARVVFLRNRPVALDGSLDERLARLHDGA